VLTSAAPFIARRSVRIQDLIAATAAAALTVSVLSGKLALPRLLDDGNLPSLWLEIRFPALLLALGLTIFLVILDSKSFAKPTDISIWFASSVTALIFYLVIRSVGLAGAAPAVVDCAYLIFQIWLLAALSQTPQGNIAIATIAVGTACLLFLLALVGVGKPELNGQGWAPIGGVITFYRIEFLGLCITLYFYLKDDRLAWLPFVGLFFFATLATLSKAALLAAALSLLIVILALLTRKRFVSLALLFVTFSLAFTAWNYRFSNSMSQRVTDAFIVTDNVPTHSKDMNTGAPEKSLLNPGQDMAFKIEYCLTKYATCQTREFVDRSGRAVLSAAALEGFASSPLIGKGLGQYLVESENLRGGGLQPYKYPHNIITELMFTGGTIALILFVVVAGIAFKICLRTSKKSLPAAAIISFTTFIFLSALASGDLYDLRLALCAALILGTWSPATTEQT
jgi:hypothetical protein